MRQESLIGIEGVRYIPENFSGVGVLTVAGSSGRVDGDRACLFARHGALTESVRWFGGPGQHAGPWEIPIETFLDRVDLLAQQCDQVILAGTSFGAEGVLLAAAHTSKVDTVVAFAPSDVVWAGVTADGRQTSHWTCAGESVPFIPLLDEWQPDTDPPSFAALYAASREANPVAAQSAKIKVERIPNVILISGGDDQVWPSVDYSRRIVARRQDHGLDTTCIVHDAAGHRAVLPGEEIVTGGMHMARGGNEDADRALGALAWETIEPLLGGAHDHP